MTTSSPPAMSDSDAQRCSYCRGFVGPEASGIHDATFQSIVRCGVDICRGLYDDVVMSGGIAMSVDISERLTKELSAARREQPVSCELNRAPRRRRRCETHNVPLLVPKATTALTVSAATGTEADTSPICERRIVIRFNWIR